MGDYLSDYTLGVKSDVSMKSYECAHRGVDVFLRGWKFEGPLLLCSNGRGGPWAAPAGAASPQHEKAVFG